MTSVSLLTLLQLLTLTASDEPTVPAGLQAGLLSRVMRYDRHFTANPVPVRVLVVHTGEATSKAFAQQLLSALGEEPSLGSLEHTDALLEFSNEASLLEEVKTRQAKVIIFAPGFAARAPALTRLLDTLDLVTVSTSASGVAEGLVLGFDLVGGKPRMFLNLPQARRQHADFRAEVLKLMTVLP